MSTEDLRLDQAEDEAERRRDNETAIKFPTSGSGRASVAAMVSVAVANVVLWAVARPGGQPAGRFLGELCGAEAVLLFSCALVMATLFVPIW